MHPGAVEACNGVDDDCDGSVDEDAGQWWSVDDDQDGWGSEDRRMLRCEQPADFVARAGDCDDGAPGVHPGVSEVCDEVDNDCDGTVDLPVAALRGRVGLWGASWKLPAASEGQRGGYSVANAGDLTGDGLGDLIIGLPGDGDDPGRAWIVSQGVVVAELLGEEPGDAAGSAVAGVGDVNGDGYNDVAVGASRHRETSPAGGWAEGAVYVLYGPFDADRALASASAKLLGGRLADGTGEALAGAGDVDGDGYADLLVGAGERDLPGAPSAGVTYVVRGPMVGTGLLADSLQLRGDMAGDAFGFAVAGVGDVNGDGLNDVLIGAPGEDSSGAEAGAAYLFYGPITENLDAIDAAAVFHGEAAGAAAGWAVAGGDVDGDGLADLLIGAPKLRAPGVSGAAYLFAGDPSGELQPGQAQVRWLGTSGRYFGASVGLAGDVDADGLGDVLLGAPVPDGVGASYLFRAVSGGDVVDSDADTWFVGRVADGSGYAVAGAGDQDGDGLADLALGAPGWSASTGRVDVFAGVKLTPPEIGGLWYADADGDGFGDPNSSTLACAAPDGFVGDHTDCDDTAATTFPGADETCNGLDDDCNGLVDDQAIDQLTMYPDADGDGVGALASGVLTCKLAEGWVLATGDCDDGDPERSPTLPELCDGLDNDCDGAIDVNATDAPPWYADRDGDAWGAGAGVLSCEPLPAYVTEAGDCDDADVDVSPDAPERCDELDNDCDGKVDEDVVTTWYLDADLDGYGTGDGVTTCDGPRGYAAEAGDCDDNDPGLVPGAEELCDGLDNDCNGAVDEELTGTWFVDEDGDGFGGEALTLCVPRPGLVEVGGDCDDSFIAVYPGAPEVCNDLDDDCDGKIDEDGTPWYADLDGDGYGDPSALLDDCEDPGGAVDSSDDCDDADAAILPGADEVCDDVDNDCDGKLDEDVTLTGYLDEDGDGFGDVQLIACVLPDGTVDADGDCDDADVAVNPDASEVCDGVDNNCDGELDDEAAPEAVPWYRDADGDGFGDPEAVLRACGAPIGYVADATDCDDRAAEAFPGADERCNDRDDDCDGSVDEDAIDPTPWFADADGDGWGVGDAVIACKLEGGAERDGDCDDTAKAVHPQAAERCNDVDDDCDGGVDEGLPVKAYYLDGDGDGFGDAADSVEACAAPVGYVTTNTDCDDAEAAVYPGAAEVCDGLDNDCDQFTDSVLVPREPSRDLAGADLTILADARDQDAGWSVASAGDVDGDGFDDVLVGVPSDLGEVGAAYLFYGPRRGELVLSDADAVLVGSAPGDLAGYAVAGAGDVNGDGYADLAVSAPGHHTLRSDGWVEGAVYVATGPVWGRVDLADVPAVLVGEGRFDFAGSSLASAGVVNGDGLDDLLIGAEDRRDAGLAAGVTYLVSAPFTGALGLEDATAIFAGTGLLDRVGSAVAAAGDVDGDGFDDVLVGAWGHLGDSAEAGSAYLFRGPLAGALTEGDATARIVGDEAGGLLGWSVASAGDVDGDGRDEVLVGAPFGAAGGEALLFGWPLAGDVPTSRARAVYKGDPGDRLGYAVSSAGDLDGDGLPDVAIGAPGRNGSAGAVLLFPALATGVQRTAHTTWSSSVAETEAGYALSPAGDIDGDGLREVLLGGPFGPDGGRVWAVQGGADQRHDLRGWWYADTDGDSYGAGIPIPSCEPISGFVTAGGDCDDSLADVKPGGQERCNGLDDDCDAAIDEGELPDGTTWFADRDADGWGDAADHLQRCDAPDGFVSEAGDCDDNANLIHPEAPEVCDGVDNDCDGELDALAVLHEGVLVAVEATDMTSPVLDDAASASEAGWAVAAAGDVDDDGEADWLYGAPGEDGDRGAVYLFLGPIDGPQRLRDAHATLRVGSDEGRKATLCHLPPGNTGNPITIEVGEPALTAHLDHGDTTGPCPGDHRREHEHESEREREHDRGDVALTGYALDSADLDGDGHNDVIVGAPGEGDGRVYIVYGPVSGDHDLRDADAILRGEDEDELAGASVSAAGDLNGDGHPDLLLSTWGEGRGEVYGFYGPVRGERDLRSADVHFTGLHTDELGAPAVAHLGDLDRDGHDDLAIAESGGEHAELRVYRGPFAGEIGRERAHSAMPIAHGERWGAASAGDVNGDGHDDLAITLPERDEVRLYASPLPADLSTATPVATLTGHRGSSFGHALTCLGDVDGDGHDDLAVGAPEDNDGAGTVSVFRGPFEGERGADEADTTHRGPAHAGLGWSLSATTDSAPPALLAGAPTSRQQGGAWLLEVHALQGADLGAAWYADDDDDGYGAGDAVLACAAPPGFVGNADDCDDAVDAIHPGGVETCNDLDDDCDALVDEGEPVGAPRWYADKDDDGYGAGAATIACDPLPGYVSEAGDCDDTRSATFPGAPETCNQRDDDCDNAVDDTPVDAPAWYIDRDGDGFATLDWPIFACVAPVGQTDIVGDCDDRDASAYPGAPETCDGRDDNCNGLLDDNASDASLWYEDADGDGHGHPELTKLACEHPPGWSAVADDCDDTRWGTAPGRPESCDGRDNDCDGAIDESGGVSWYADADNDGFGVKQQERVVCDAGPGWSRTPGDCDDTAASVHPWAAESCDGVDSDCDGKTDDGDEIDRLTWHLDRDLDGYGRDTSLVSACTQPAGTTTIGGDCRDWDAGVYPNAPERCNALDDDCDGAIDEDPVDPFTWYEDADRDGHGVATSTTTACNQPTGYASIADDCDDTERTIAPGRAEVCDHLDNDCDGTADEGIGSVWYRDGDADSYGDALTTRQACDTPTGFVPNKSDCDDTDATRHPRADERCDNVDSDCDGKLNDGDEVDAPLWYLDKDLDGFGRDGYPIHACAAVAAYVDAGGDCKDWDAAVYPGADEVCDGADNNCDGVKDEGEAVDATTWHADFDRDGHGSTELTLDACAAPAGWLADASDCDDRNAATFACPTGAWRQVAAGRDFTCGLRGSGAVVCWGDDRAGVVSGAPSGVFASVFAGDDHACALTAAGSLRCWGDNSDGQAPIARPGVLSAGLGSAHSCAIGLDDKPSCWGGCTDGVCTPPASAFRALDSGDTRSCALAYSGALSCWGTATAPPAGRFAVLALASSDDADHGCALTVDQRLLCWNEQTSRTPRSGYFTQLAAGDANACGLRRDGSAECWSLSNGPALTPNRGPFRDLAVGGAHACAITRAGDLSCWGDDSAGQSDVP